MEGGGGGGCPKLVLGRAGPKGKVSLAVVPAIFAGWDPAVAIKSCPSLWHVLNQRFRTCPFARIALRWGLHDESKRLGGNRQSVST